MGEYFRDNGKHCAIFYDQPYILGLQVNGDKVPDSASYLKRTLQDLFALISQKQMPSLTQTVSVLAANRGKVPEGVQANLLEKRRNKAKKRQGNIMEVVSESEDEGDIVTWPLYLSQCNACRVRAVLSLCPTNYI